MYGPIGCREERASVFDVISTSECLEQRHRKRFVRRFPRAEETLLLLILVTRTLAGWFLAIKLSCSPIFMLIGLILVILCLASLVLVNRPPFVVNGCDFLDFLVAAARSFHFFYSLARFSYPASLAVGRRVVVTAASRPNVTSMQIAMHACPR